VQIVSIGQEISEIQNSVPGCISSSEPKRCHPVQPFERHWCLRLKYLMSHWMKKARQPTYRSWWKTQQVVGGALLRIL